MSDVMNRLSNVMNKQCSRCDGCGRISGSGRSERPWNSFGDVPPHTALQKIMGMQRPRTCPDCDGEGVKRSEE